MAPATRILPRRPGRLEQERTAWIVLVAAMALYATVQLWLTRGTTLFIDEITMFVEDRGPHPSALLAPFNEHLELVRRLLYAVGFKLFGASTSFFVARLVEAAGVIVLAGLVFVVIKRRLGPAAALAPTILLLFFGSAWELNFAVSGIGNVFALAAGVGALLLLERRRRREDVLACVLLVVSVTSFTTGVAFAAGALCLILLDRGSPRRVWIALVPIGVYAAWLLWVRLAYVPTHGEVQHISLTNLLLIPNMSAQQAASTVGALTGLNYNFQPTGAFAVFSTSSDYGAPLAALAAAALIWRLRGGAHPLLWALIATLIAYWAELALGYGVGRNPSTVRYVYASGTIALLIAGEAIGIAVRSRTALVALYAVTALALLGNVARLRDGMHFYRAFGSSARAQLAALEIAGPAADPNYVMQIGFLSQVTAGPYLDAVHRNGSPAYSESALLGQPQNLRQGADTVLVGAMGIRAEPRPPAERVTGCLRRAGASGSSTSLPIGPPGVALSSATAAQISLSRYAPGPGVPVGNMPAGRAVDLRVPRDRSTRPWRLTITPAPSEVTVCVLPGPG